MKAQEGEECGNVKRKCSSAFSVVVNTFAVMGVNTAVLQAALLSRAKLNSILPAKVAARIDITEGHFKFEALPVSAPEHVAAVQ